MANGLQQLTSACSMQRTRRAITLPNGKEFEWWMTPLTLAERERAQKRSGKDSEDVLTVALNVLILKARDANGNALFQPGEIVDLKTNLPESVLTELIREVFSDETFEEVSEDGESKTAIDVTPKRSSRS